MSNLKPYPKYKPSGVEWLSDVPEHWNVIPVKRVFMVLGGSTPKSAVPDNWGGDVVWVTPADLSKLPTMGIYGSARMITPKGLASCGANMVPSGSIVLSTRAPIGSMGIAKTPLCTNQGCKSLVPFGISNIGFYAHFFTVSSDQLNVRGKGTTFLELSGDELGAFEIISPPSDEQTAIATFLDRETGRIDALVEEKTRFIELLKEKRQALITQAVTKGLDPNVKMKDSGVEWIGDVPEHWHVKKIAHLTPVQRGASPRPIDDSRYFDNDGEYGWVRIQDVTRSKGPLISTKDTLSKLGASKSVKMNPGALFLSIAATVGVPCITKIKCCIHDGFVYFPMLQIEPMWLFRIFEARECFVGLGKMGTQLNLNTDTVGGISIPLPPPTEVDMILSDLERQLMRLDSLHSLTLKSIGVLKERRSALITAAVTGKIDVRETK